MSAIGFLIAIAPLLVLVALLLGRHYPGEAVIERLRSLIDPAAPATGRPASGAGQLSGFEITVRGGRLIACSLAGRAPPATA